MPLRFYVSNFARSQIYNHRNLFTNYFFRFIVLGNPRNHSPFVDASVNQKFKKFLVFGTFSASKIVTTLKSIFTKSSKLTFSFVALQSVPMLNCLPWYLVVFAIVVLFFHLQFFSNKSCASLIDAPSFNKSIPPDSCHFTGLKLINSTFLLR